MEAIPPFLLVEEAKILGLLTALVLVVAERALLISLDFSVTVVAEVGSATVGGGAAVGQPGGGPLVRVVIGAETELEVAEIVGAVKTPFVAESTT